MRRWGTIGAVILFLALAAARVSAWPVTMDGARVESGPVTREVLGIGLLESAHEAPVSFEVSGRVVELFVDEGDPVAVGTPLAAVDASDARLELGVSRASAAVADAELARARADLEHATVSAALASRDRARSEALFAAGDLAEAQRDAAVERDDGARATVRALEAAVRRARSGLAAASGGARLREARVDDGVLVSPIAGFVVRRRAEVGQWVAAGAPAFTVVGADDLQVEAWVDETALGRLAEGQPVRLVFRSDETRTYPGRVSRIGREVDRQTHELQVDVSVSELPPNFAVGQRADAWIELDRRDDVLRVPRGWCDADGCLVVDGGRATRRPVGLGLVGREWVEVVSGLTADDQVLAPETAAVGRRVRVAVTP